MISAVGHSYVDAATGTALDAWFPFEDLPNRYCDAVSVGLTKGNLVEVEIDPDAAPTDPIDAYLRLQLISSRQYRPHGLNLDGIFGVLTNVAWTSAGPVLPEQVPVLQSALAEQQKGCFVRSVDKFPRMLDYVQPSGVRIADGDRVRLGAHLAEGTTVMHEGFCNFNAGTLGPAMIEGRITAGVVLGANSDLGGGASLMGTLSGGGTEVVSVGENCLIGANAGIGISLGDNCTVAAGVYVTAGTKVTLPDASVVKALELSGQSNLLYLQDSVNGKIIARPNDGSKWEGLNSALHMN